MEQQLRLRQESMTRRQNADEEVAKLRVQVEEMRREINELHEAIARMNPHKP